jgi:allantoate deiminase
MKQQAGRAIALCREIANLSEEPGRTTRRYLTAPLHAVHALLRARMAALGMRVTVDAVGNLRGILIGNPLDKKRLMIGSHIDTVPGAGAFDGVLGVALAIELAEIAAQDKIPLNLEVIAFSEEEGVRFGVPFMGSRAVAGNFDAQLLMLKDAEGISCSQAIRNFGLNPDEIAAASAQDQLHGFVELHIEQGPLLEAENLSLAAVASIAGQMRAEITFTGHANHAGTTPMHLRHDALMAAAEWMLAVEKLAKETTGLAATTGKIEVVPNAENVIPGTVKLSLDLRHASDARRADALQRLILHAQQIGKQRGVKVESSQKLNQPAVPMDERLTALMSESVSANGFGTRVMTSGAGHDAMVMAACTPTTMLFLRSPGGISHHASERIRTEDVEAALVVGSDFLRRFSGTIR